MAALKLSNFYNCDCIFHLSSRFNPRSKGDRAPPSLLVFRQFRQCFTGDTTRNNKP